MNKQSQKPKDPTSLVLKNYAEALDILKRKIQDARLKASVFVNTELITLYWDIGAVLSTKIQKDGVLKR